MNGSSGRDTIVDWPPPRRPARRGRLFLLLAIAVVVFGGGTALTYYVDAIWFASLGYADVFWKSLNIEAAVFAVFAGVTFAALYGSFLALKPERLGELAGGPILINGQPFKLPVEPVLRLIALAVSALIALATGAGIMGQWPTLALYWYAQPAASPTLDPIFSRPLTFYLFTLPAWQLIAGWLMTLAVIATIIAVFFIAITGGGRVLTGRRTAGASPWRGVSVAFAAFLVMLAVRVYLGRFERLFDDHTIFSGVTYTDAHVTLTGLLVVSLALLLGAAIALVNAASAPSLRWLVASVIPAAVTYAIVGIFGWYVSSFIVKPNELVREQPYIAHNIRARPRRPARVSGGQRRCRGRHRQQPADTAEHPPLGLARAAGHAAPDPGDPHLLRFSRHRHRPLSDRRRDAAGDARRARAQRGEAAREQPQLDQREADLHARLRRDDEPRERLHA